jgi:hypothetical protein
MNRGRTETMGGREETHAMGIEKFPWRRHREMEAQAGPRWGWRLRERRANARAGAEVVALSPYAVAVLRLGAVDGDVR